jgi:F-type H+-transporting ATPase subunit a
MAIGSSKSLLVAAFSLIGLFFYSSLWAQKEYPQPGLSDTSMKETKKGPNEEKSFDPAKVILEHVSDGHEFHFAVVGGRHLTIPLPVILYSPGVGWSVFMSSAFDHGERVYNGYRLLEEHFMDEHGLTDSLDAKGEPLFKSGRIYRADGNGMPDPKSKLYDFSLTRNVVQTLISVLLLIFIMIGIARRYTKGHGVRSAPTGFQNAVEPMITFIRDEVGKPNLGSGYERYMPFLLTVFFFILINNLIGLVPGTANVTGNIAFTAVLGIISFIVILLNTNKHFWSHIFNPPVPMGVKFIMIPVEILGIFTKPFALIIRLFANMISGHIIILSFICLIFIFGAMNTALGWGTSPFFIVLAVFIYLIEILVAFIQAYIFANLTAVFVGMAMEGAHHGEANEHDDAVLI